MRVELEGCILELHQGDITLEETEAIVNAANSRLAGGGGVDGAIHRRGGPEIMAQTRAKYPAGCPTGSAVASVAGRLKATHVIHAVGPVWKGGGAREAELLASAYRRSFELALETGCRSIALPALSTGAYGYPMDQAARIALTTAVEFLQTHGQPQRVRFVLFDAGAYGGVRCRAGRGHARAPALGTRETSTCNSPSPSPCVPCPDRKPQSARASTNRARRANARRPKRPCTRFRRP